MIGSSANDVELASCTGHCCDPVQLPLGPAELRARADDAAQKRARGEVLSTLYSGCDAEVELIADMLAYLGPSTVNATNGQPTKPGYHDYACVNWNAATGRCGIYATRPNLCRDYPYGRSCEYRDCTRRTTRACMEQKITLDDVKKKDDPPKTRMSIRFEAELDLSRSGNDLATASARALAIIESALVQALKLPDNPPSVGSWAPLPFTSLRFDRLEAESDTHRIVYSAKRSDGAVEKAFGG